MATSQHGLPPLGPASVLDFIATSPFEISALVFSHLDNCDLKALRLTCNKLADLVRPHLRFKRVFISANPLNVQVFRAIAEHETFRHDVREIVWDDALYEKPRPPDPRLPDEYDDSSDEEDVDDSDDDEDENDRKPKPPYGFAYWHFGWYHKHCKANIECLERRRGNDVLALPQHVEISQQLNAQLPIEVAYAHYLELLEQQNQVLSTSADVAAFEWALENDRFPNLKRLTLTPAAHGIPFKPLYLTPAIRALPYGFNYPLPRGWPAPEEGCRIGYPEWDREEYRSLWRGFRHVVRILARQASTKIQELIFDGNQVNSGLTCGIFHAPEPCVEYDDLVAMIKKPGFTTLRLNLMVGAQDSMQYIAFRTGLLKKALEADLRHFTLETDEDDTLERRPRPLHWTVDHFVPLRSIFPVEAWKNLAHFGLSRFLVKQQDLLDFLAALPQTLRSVELSMLWFMKGNGNYRELLFGIRDDLGWQRRTARPRLLIRAESYDMLSGRAIWLEDELKEFLYNGGENPYSVPSSRGMIIHADDIPLAPALSCGFGKEKDEFEPRFERPHESKDKLIRWGIVRDWTVE
ncbi:Putative F-box domain-containing protein [Colletotrichum destructivum]|uniref:F-box domain-containing protein n=1 Tax=Colletotrichum destructivum TaxID=34406 RepID=A0AAX4IWG7_9PEZI|nr:Putative F-box domain-containing protein [Colletotrichum destructivum]